MRIAAIVLAAGASRRLGRPKQLVAIGGETLLARTLRVAREAGAAPVLAVLGAHADSIAPTVPEAEVVFNPDWQRGIASSIRAGIEAVMQLDLKAGAAMLLVCDQPGLTAAHLSKLMEAFAVAGQTAIAASRYAGKEAIPAIFPASQFAALLALEGDAGARFLLRDAPCAVVAVDFPGGEFDIDTLDDLAAASLPRC